MAVKPGMGRKSASKNPPILSHEFVIQNHADIVSCVVMVFLIGLMVQATTPIASLFITLHHNVSGVEPTREVPRGEPFLYESGWKDACVVFFYSLVCIVMHAIVQEYFLDKISKRFHLSKSKLSSLNESGQYIIFHIMTAVWGADVIVREGFIWNIALLWDAYPVHPMSFVLKLWWVVQASYWIHTLPELYFQRIKREEWAPKIRRAVANFAFVALAYGFKFQRIGVCLITLHAFGEVIAHTTRLNSILRNDKEDSIARALNFINSAAFVGVRLLTTVLSVLTFWYGLGGSPASGAAGAQPIYFRVSALVTVGALQVYLMYNFITQQIALRRETSKALSQQKSKKEKKEKVKKEKVKRSSVEESDLPEVDQNTNKNIRLRAAAAAKTK